MMGEFEIIERRIDLPFRSRRAHSGYAVFRTNEHTVLVHPRVCGLLTVAARYAEPCETGGLLAGRVLRDAEGPYTLVQEAVNAPREAGGRGHITLSPEMTARLRDEAASRFPTCDVIGWWHSHTVEIGYSEVDRANQQMWTDSGHVGLLVFARADSKRALAYLGPGSEPMRTIDDKAFELDRRQQDARYDTNPRVDAAAPPGNPSALAMETAYELRQLDRGWRRTIVAAAAVCVLALLGCLIGVTLMVRTVQKYSVNRAVVMSCVPQASDQFTCRFSPPSERLQWWQDGKPMAAKSAERVDVMVPSGGSTLVELRRSSDEGAQLLGSLKLDSTIARAAQPPQSGMAER